jgi:hypothetical protein
MFDWTSMLVWVALTERAAQNAAAAVVFNAPMSLRMLRLQQLEELILLAPHAPWRGIANTQHAQLDAVEMTARAVTDLRDILGLSPTDYLEPGDAEQSPPWISEETVVETFFGNCPSGTTRLDLLRVLQEPRL